MQVDPSVLFPAMAAVVTATLASGLTYLTVLRAKSGRINSTEADVLWGEAGAIRRELREQIADMQDAIAQSNEHIRELRSENAQLKAEVLKLRTENADLVVQVDTLRTENVELRSRVLKGEAADDAHERKSL